MTQLADHGNDLLITSIAIMSVAFYLRIIEAASIRVRNLAADSATVTFFDKKTHHCWITRLTSSYILRFMQCTRATALRLGRKSIEPLVKGGCKTLEAAMCRSLAGIDY